MTVAIRRLNAKSPEFAEQLSQLLTRPEERDAGLATTVADIIASVREKGDEALLHLTRRHDEHPAESLDEIPAGEPPLQALGRLGQQVLNPAFLMAADPDQGRAGAHQKIQLCRPGCAAHGSLPCWRLRRACLSQCKR